MKASDKGEFGLATPLDFWEMIAVAWIRLAASTAHAFLATVPRPEPARGEPDKERARAEEQELLLHVLE